ncbi:MAG: long-chain fatty acid--CoA ligase [Trueperaceae bacterium]
MPLRVAIAPEDGARVEFGRTLASLLDEAATERPNPAAFRERHGGAWQSVSTEALRERAQNMALGLRNAGLAPGDRVALFTHSDLTFVIADLACASAGLVDVPIYLTHPPGAVRHILAESGCRAVLVSDAALLQEVEDVADGVESVAFVAVARPAASFVASERRTTYAALEKAGAEARATDPGAASALAAALDADTLATIIYTSGTTGTPKGVMLTHQNVSSNAIASITGLSTFRRGAEEVVLSFLPLSHVFARTLHYAAMWSGATVSFGTPETVREDLGEVRPTFIAAVPRVLEKSWERIQRAGDDLHGVKKLLYRRALAFARNFDVTRPPAGIALLEHRLLDALVYRRWREALGGRLRTIIVGGAALRAELVNVLGAAGIDVLQGYGLTETSPVMTFNRHGRNRPGTVGEPVAGTEVAVNEEGEVLARGPHVMRGYFARDDETAEVIDEEGWFHTGDLGELDDGYLSITGRIKYLFKLSTGKYVVPQPLEERMEAHPLVAAALVVGEGEKYCAALVFVDHEALAARGVAATLDDVANSGALEELRAAVRAANDGMPHWSTVHRIAVSLDTLDTASGTITPKLSVRRERVLTRHAGLVRRLYEVSAEELGRLQGASEPTSGGSLEAAPGGSADGSASGARVGDDAVIVAL